MEYKNGRVWRAEPGRRMSLDKRDLLLRDGWRQRGSMNEEAEGWRPVTLYGGSWTPGGLSFVVQDVI